MEGKGWLKDKKGDLYEGQFQKDMIWGKGMKTLYDGTTYSSDAFKDGVVRGNTNVQWSWKHENSKVRKYGAYVGQMKDDAQHGKGRVEFLESWEGPS